MYNCVKIDEFKIKKIFEKKKENLSKYNKYQNILYFN